MTKTELIKEIKRWLDDYDNTRQHNADFTIALKDDAHGLLSRSLLYLELEEKSKLINWNELADILRKLEKNRDETISRHAKGLLKALKLDRF
jgi:hypothetical protein